MEKLTVLVTGASRGIGRAIALELAKSGYDLVIHASKPSEALTQTEQLAIGYGVTVRTLTFDVKERDLARSILLEDIAKHGAYYGVVCNAGISRDMTFAAMEGEDWDAVIRTDLDSFFNVVQPLVMPMVRRRKPGRIIVTSSVSGIIGNRGQVNYSAAKAGLIGAVKALAVELASRAITVNAVAPGLIKTDMVTDEVLEHALAAIPMKRAGEAHEVASAVRFLMSQDASYITRQVIQINGGLS